MNFNNNNETNQVDTTSLHSALAHGHAQSGNSQEGSGSAPEQGVCNRDWLAKAAEDYIGAGFCLIPIDASTKRPLFHVLPRDEHGKPSWSALVAQPAALETVLQWIEVGAQLAVACGQPSGGLLILDFDVPSFYPAWLEKAGDLAAGLPTQRTGGGGFQVLLRCDNPYSSQKLAWMADEASPTGRRIAIETRGEGGYALLAPSRHPSGSLYQVIQGNLSQPPYMAQDDADILLVAALQIDEAPLSRQQSRAQDESRASECTRHRRSQVGQESVIEAYQKAHNIEQCLERYGYKRLPGNSFARPGSDRSSVTVRDGRSFHHSTNDPLCDGYWHKPFDLFCGYDHGGDAKSAVKMAAQELGIRRPSRLSGRSSNGSGSNGSGSNRSGGSQTDANRNDGNGSEGNDSDGGNEDAGDERQAEPESSRNQATLLVTLATQNAEYFRNAAGETFVTMRTRGYPETYRLHSKHVRHWLSRLFYQEKKKTPAEQCLKDAMRVLEGLALFEGQEHEVFLRIAEWEDKIYIDLCDPQWRVIEVSREGWRVVSDSPVKFRRARGMLPLLAPVPGGKVNELRSFLNIGSEGEFQLIVGWLLGCFRSNEPFPGLGLNGEQGSCKSTTSKMLRLLIDPNEAPVRREPSEPRDLAIAANNSYVVALDNMSGVKQWLSDNLCCLATGSGFVTRQLHTDDEEMIFTAMRPFLLNGINEIIVASDLLDRTILIMLPRITEENRKTERELWQAFDAARPRILGALLDAVVVGLQRLPDTHLTHSPRMADFARWVTACESALGWEAGSFLEAYRRNRSEANTVVMEASPVAVWLHDLLREKTEWIGSASQLLDELNHRVESSDKKDLTWQKEWPKNARSLSIHLRRIAPNLRAEGLTVDELGRRGDTGTKQWLLRSQPIVSSPETIAAHNGVKAHNAAEANNAKNLAHLVLSSPALTDTSLNGPVATLKQESSCDDLPEQSQTFASVASVASANKSLAAERESDNNWPELPANDPFADDPFTDDPFTDD